MNTRRFSDNIVADSFKFGGDRDIIAYVHVISYVCDLCRVR